MDPAHFLLTRSVYHPDLWPIAANRRRLEVFAGVTVASLAAQTVDEWTWLLAVSPDDELRAERLEVAASAGVPVVPVEVLAGTKRSTVALAAYRADWAAAMSDGPRLTTRIDDDDAFTPDAFARIRRRVAGWGELPPVRRSLMLPVGFRVWEGRYVRVRHESNAMATLYTPAGDSAHVYTFSHREIAAHAEVERVDLEPGWLWFRHPDTLSGHKAATRPVTRALRQLFPVDWELVGTSPTREPVAGPVRFK